MSEDEEATLATLATYQEVIAGLVAEHQGRIFAVAGDGVLAEFASPVQAVRCAVAVQRALERRNADLPERRRLVFRIGVNLSDVIARPVPVYSIEWALAAPVPVDDLNSGALPLPEKPSIAVLPFAN